MDNVSNCNFHLFCLFFTLQKPHLDELGSPLLAPGEVRSIAKAAPSQYLLSLINILGDLFLFPSWWRCGPCSKFGKSHHQGCPCRNLNRVGGPMTCLRFCNIFLHFGNFCVWEESCVVKRAVSQGTPCVPHDTQFEVFQIRVTT